MGDEIESYLSSVDWEEKIISQGIEQNSRKWLLNDIALYLKEEYNISEINGRNSVKAKELLDGRPPSSSELKNQSPVVADKSERERKLVFKKIVRDAQEKGYIQNSNFQSLGILNCSWRENSTLIRISTIP